MLDSIMYMWYRLTSYFSQRKRMKELKERDPYIYEE